MKQSAKRLFSSIFSLIFVIAAFFVFFNFVQPSYEEILSLKSELESKNQLLGAEQDVVKRIEKLVSIYEGSEEARFEASFALPSTPMMAEALAQINGLILNNNLTPQAYGVSVQMEQSSSNEEARRAPSDNPSALVRPVGPISFQMKVFGTYADFKNFLKNIETNVRIFDVKSISVQQNGKPTQGNYSFDVRLVAYYQQEMK